MSDKLLEVKNLCTSFRLENGVVPAVDDVSFQVGKGEIVGIVGESGSGKTVTSLSIMQLLKKPPASYDSGKILFGGKDLLKTSEKEMRQIRGNQIAMIFQEPMTSLNPVMRVGEQISEVLSLHCKMPKKDLLEKSVEALRMVEIPSSEQRVMEFPHQMSGGMKQRVMIAMALACNPELLIADEPTTALDVTIQAQILELMVKLRAEYNMGILLITHDLGVIAEMAERVIVMYAGKIMEEGDVDYLFEKPLHPYTIGLLESIPRLDTPKGDLPVIKGSIPTASDMPKGCLFHPRCEYAKDVCSQEIPPLKAVSEKGKAACWLL